MARGVSRRTGQRPPRLKGELSSEGYDRLYRCRLLPVIRHINAYAAGSRSALVTFRGLAAASLQTPSRVSAQLALEMITLKPVALYGPGTKQSQYNWEVKNHCPRNQLVLYVTSLT
jgi:hypothetical protein